MKNIDLEALKQSNPDLYNLVVKGRVIRSFVPGIDQITKNFPIQSKPEKELFQDAAAGFIATFAIAAIADQLFNNKKKVK